MRYNYNPMAEPRIKYRKSYVDICCLIYNLLKNKDIKFNHFAEIFLDNKGRWGINSFQSFDGCAFVETIFLFHLAHHFVVSFFLQTIWNPGTAFQVR